MSDLPSGLFYFCKNAVMEEISDSAYNETLLDDDELNRLVKFFDVLIEMDFASKKLEGDKDVRMD